MSSINAESFRSNNRILFSTKIVHDHMNWKSPKGTRETHTNEGDYIDLNKNDAIDRKQFAGEVGWFNYQYCGKMLEPSLAVPLSTLKSAAQERNTEIITQDDANDFGVTYQAFDTERRGDREFVYDRKNLGDFARELAPLDQDAKWAIDLKNDEFIIFKPGTTEAR